MAKVKNKRNNGLADKVHHKRKLEAIKKKINPFEVHINREKIKVLGKKSKHDKGLPGVSRAKAVQKRKETLGTEMKLMNKTNTFIDRRIGEKNAQLSAEDKMVARFAAERVKQHSRKNIYNLADDEVLTHRGQTLEQVEKFDDPRSDDEVDDDGKGFGGLDDDFVSDGHFGGGMLSRTAYNDGAKSHKDLIEQLIAESKKRKAEKQKEKEQTLDLTEKLDSEWKDLQPVVFKRQKVAEEEASLIDKVLSQAEKQGSDYDKTMRELRFEKRGTPSDAIKSDEKQANEERAKLEQWERELKQRMEGEDVQKKTTTTAKHRSAEDLEDNFELEDEKVFMLAYDNDGKPLVPDHILKDYSVPNAKPKYEDGVSDTSDDEESESENETKSKEKSDEESSDASDDDEEIDDDLKVDIRSFNKLKEELKVEIKEESDLVFKSTKGSNDDSYDSKKVNSNTNGSDNVNEVKIGKEQKSTPKAKEQSILLPNKHDDEGSDDGESDDEESGDGESDDEDDESEKESPQKDDYNDLMESDGSESEMDVKEELTKVDKYPMEGSQDLDLKGTPAEKAAAICKLMNRYDSSEMKNNKEYLSKVFSSMLQTTNDIFTNVTKEDALLKAFSTFDRLVPHFYDLAQLNKVSSKKCLMELIKEKRDKYKRNVKKIPDMDTLVLFKLVSLIYPTSDFRHPVTTPSLIFMSEILTYSRFNDAHSISRGFFVTALILEYTSLSKRLVPSALNFLRGVLFLAANTSIVNPIQVVPPFRIHRDAKILKIEDNCSKMVVVNKMAAKDLYLNEIDDDFKIRCLMTCVRMTKEFFDNFSDLEAQECLFESHIKLLGRVDLENYPKKITKLVTEIVKDMKDSLEVKTFTPLSREKKRPKALRLYEPDVQEVFTGSKNSKLSREAADRARLQTKYKKEMKGALREIRRDKAYVASVKIKQKIASDNIRKDKVKQIYKDASIQQGELNKLKRMK